MVVPSRGGWWRWGRPVQAASRAAKLPLESASGHTVCSQQSRLLWFLLFSEPGPQPSPLFSNCPIPSKEFLSAKSHCYLPWSLPWAVPDGGGCHLCKQVQDRPLAPYLRPDSQSRRGKGSFTFYSQSLSLSGLQTSSPGWEEGDRHHVIPCLFSHCS